MSKKLYFPKKSLEYIDKIENLSEEDKKYYDLFLDEYYSTSISPKNILTQIHNTPQLIKSVYDQTNSRNRDLYSKLKLGDKLEHTPEDCSDTHKENKYSSLLKTSTFNETILELFDDFSLEISTSKLTQVDALNLLKRFYVEISRVNREEAKFKKNNKINRMNTEGK